MDELITKFPYLRNITTDDNTIQVKQLLHTLLINVDIDRDTRIAILHHIITSSVDDNDNTNKTSHTGTSSELQHAVSELNVVYDLTNDISYDSADYSTRFTCDRCDETPITGTRWRCLSSQCHDYDLCNSCKLLSDSDSISTAHIDTHRSDHQMKQYCTINTVQDNANKHAEQLMIPQSNKSMTYEQMIHTAKSISSSGDPIKQLYEILTGNTPHTPHYNESFIQLISDVAPIFIQQYTDTPALHSSALDTLLVYTVVSLAIVHTTVITQQRAESFVTFVGGLLCRVSDQQSSAASLRQLHSYMIVQFLLKRDVLMDTQLHRQSTDTTNDSTIDLLRIKSTAFVDTMNDIPIQYSSTSTDTKSVLNSESLISHLLDECNDNELESSLLSQTKSMIVNLRDIYRTDLINDGVIISDTRENSAPKSSDPSFAPLVQPNESIHQLCTPIYGSRWSLQYSHQLQSPSKLAQSDMIAPQLSIMFTLLCALFDKQTTHTIQHTQQWIECCNDLLIMYMSHKTAKIIGSAVGKICKRFMNKLCKSNDQRHIAWESYIINHSLTKLYKHLHVDQYNNTIDAIRTPLPYWSRVQVYNAIACIEQTIASSHQKQSNTFSNIISSWPSVINVLVLCTLSDQCEHAAQPCIKLLGSLLVKDINNVTISTQHICQFIRTFIIENSNPEMRTDASQFIDKLYSASNQSIQCHIINIIGDYVPYASQWGIQSSAFISLCQSITHTTNQPSDNMTAKQALLRSILQSVYTMYNSHRQHPYVNVFNKLNELLLPLNVSIASSKQPCRACHNTVPYNSASNKQSKSHDTKKSLVSTSSKRNGELPDSIWTTRSTTAHRHSTTKAAMPFASLQSNYTSIRLSDAVLDNKFSHTSRAVRLTTPLDIAYIHLRVNETNTAVQLKAVHVFCTPSAVPDISSLPLTHNAAISNNWIFISTLQLTTSTEAKSIMLELPVKAAAILFVYDTIDSDLTSENKLLTCPRCGIHVLNSNGVCSQCRESANQCRQCRAIDYELMGRAFTCAECGYCKYAQLSFTLYAKKSNPFGEVENEKQRQSLMQNITKLNQYLAQQLVIHHTYVTQLNSILQDDNVVNDTTSSITLSSQLANAFQIISKTCIQTSQLITSAYQLLVAAQQQLAACLSGNDTFDYSTTHIDYRPLDIETTCLRCNSTYVNNVISMLLSTHKSIQLQSDDWTMLHEYIQVMPKLKPSFKQLINLLSNQSSTCSRWLLQHTALHSTHSTSTVHPTIHNDEPEQNIISSNRLLTTLNCLALSEHDPSNLQLSLNNLLNCIRRPKLRSAVVLLLNKFNACKYKYHSDFTSVNQTSYVLVDMTHTITSTTDTSLSVSDSIKPVSLNSHDRLRAALTTASLIGRSPSLSSAQPPVSSSDFAAFLISHKMHANASDEKQNASNHISTTAYDIQWKTVAIDKKQDKISSKKKQSANNNYTLLHHVMLKLLEYNSYMRYSNESNWLLNLLVSPISSDIRQYTATILLSLAVCSNVEIKEYTANIPTNDTLKVNTDPSTLSSPESIRATLQQYKQYKSGKSSTASNNKSTFKSLPIPLSHKSVCQLLMLLVNKINTMSCNDGMYSTELFQLMNILIGDMDTSRREYLYVHGLMPILLNKLEYEVNELSYVEQSSHMKQSIYTSYGTHIHRYAMLNGLTSLITNLLQSQCVLSKSRAYTQPLLLYYIRVRSWMLQRSITTDRIAEQLHSCVKLLVGSDNKLTIHTYLHALSTLDYTNNVRALSYIAEQLGQIVNPPQQQQSCNLYIKKSATQEEYVRGRLKSNPYKSSDVGTTMNDVVKLIRTELPLSEDIPIDLLVSGKIISPNCNIMDVHRQVFMQHQSANTTTHVAARRVHEVDSLRHVVDSVSSRIYLHSALLDDAHDDDHDDDDHAMDESELAASSAFYRPRLTFIREYPSSTISAESPMVITFRLTGLDGEATEDRIESLTNTDDVDIDDNEKYGICVEFQHIIGEVSGIELLLQRLLQCKQQNELVDTLRAKLIEILNYCFKLDCNRSFSFNSGQYTHELIKQLTALVFNESTLSSVVDHVISMAQLATVVLQNDPTTTVKASLVKRYLSSITQPHVQSNTVLTRALYRLLTMMIYNNKKALSLTIGYFISKMDIITNTSISGIDPVELEKFQLFIDCIQANNDINDPIKQQITNHNLTKLLFSYIVTQYQLAYPQALDTIKSNKKRVHMDNVSIQSRAELLQHPMLHHALRLLCGIVHSHAASQQIGVECGALSVLHKLEQISDNSKLGVLAENLLNSMKYNNKSIESAIDDIRYTKRQNKKQAALVQRAKIMAQMGLTSPTIRTPQIPTTLPPDFAVDIIDDSPGLHCMVCHEGYQYKPNDTIAFYTYCKQVDIDVNTLFNRSSLPVISGVSTVTHFNLIHIQCHNDASKADKKLKPPKQEWQGAAIRNSHTLCNNLYPIFISTSMDKLNDRYTTLLSQYQQHIESYWSRLNWLTRSNKYKFELCMYDMTQLLYKYTFEESFSDVSRGGGRHSNANLLIYTIQHAIYILHDSTDHSKRKELQNQLSQSFPIGLIINNLEYASSSDINYNQFIALMAYSLLCHTYNEWKLIRVRAMKLALLLSQQYHQSITSKPVKKKQRNNSIRPDTPSSPALPSIDSTEIDPLSLACRPAIILLYIIDRIHSTLDKWDQHTKKLNHKFPTAFKSATLPVATSSDASAFRSSQLVSRWWNIILNDYSILDDIAQIMNHLVDTVAKHNYLTDLVDALDDDYAHELYSDKEINGNIEDYAESLLKLNK